MKWWICKAIGSMYVIYIYMVCHGSHILPSIYPSQVSIYTSTMDPSWECHNGWTPSHLDRSNALDVCSQSRPPEGEEKWCPTAKTRWSKKTTHFFNLEFEVWYGVISWDPAQFLPLLSFLNWMFSDVSRRTIQALSARPWRHGRWFNVCWS